MATAKFFPIARAKPGGFTLIEVMVVVAVVAIMASIALPSFLDSIRKGRRSDAFAALSALQQAQERWRGNRAAYANNAQLTPRPSDDPPGLGVSATSSKGYYAISIDAAGATVYTATAVAVAGTSQSHDTNCSTLRVRLKGGNIEYGGCAGCALPEPDAVLSDPNRCWVR